MNKCFLISKTSLIGLLLLLLAAPLSNADEEVDDPIPTNAGFSQAADPWDPFADASRVNERMSRLFKDFFGSSGFSGAQGSLYRQNMDFVEKDKEYKLSVDLPGMEKDKIDIEVEGNVLTISGERKREEKEEKDDDDGVSFYQSRSYGKFQRSLELPKNANSDAISAEYKNGVLKLVIPKLKPSKVEKVKKIKIG